MKKFSKKTIAILLTMMMVLTGAAYPVCSFAGNAPKTYDALGDSEDFESFTRTEGGYTTNYYDIYEGQKEGRGTSYDMEALMQKALYETKVKGTDYTPAEYWAAFANGVFASNPESYYSYGGKSYKKRFTQDVNKGDGYGNLQKALSSLEGSRQYTGKGKAKTCDINTLISGRRTATNLNDVQEAAYRSLVEVKPGKIKTSDFRKFGSIKTMADDDSNGTVMYNMLTTRDREGKTFRYTYNCLGIAYSDFSITPITAQYNEDEGNSTGATTALKDYETLDAARTAAKAGKEIAGFKTSASDKGTVSSFTNESTEYVSQDITVEISKAEELTSEISHSKQVSFSSTQSVNFSFGKDTDIFRVEGGFSFTEGELWEDGVSESNTTSHSESQGGKQTVPLPGHTGVVQSMYNTSYIDTVNYDCPVEISYTVTIFSYNGCYYDDNAATTYFTSTGYSQSAFISQFKDANENLRQRMNKDAGYDETHGLTKGIKVKHGSMYQRDNYDWDNPWVSHLDYNNIKNSINDIATSDGFNDLTYEKVTNGLTNNRAISLEGGTLTRTGKGVQGNVGAILPLYTLKQVKLKNTEDSTQTIALTKKLNVSALELTGIDEQNGDFYKFNADKGSWVLVDEVGEKITSSDVISLKENANGDYIVTGLAEGTAYVKYVVEDQAYPLFSTNLSEKTYVKSSDVKKTPIITIEVKKDAAQSEEQTEESGNLPEVTDTEKDEIIAMLECEPGECSIAQATLFIKNNVGEDLDLNERMYVSALLQLAGDEINYNSVQDKYETDAVVWAMKEGLFDELGREFIGVQSGITELEFAEIAYKAAVKYGFNTDCEDVSGEYSGFENLDDFEKSAMNWAISKGILTEDETTSKAITPDRIISDKEAAAFFNSNPYSK